jgi:membrane protease YdiL (CAAX protease family)
MPLIGLWQRGMGLPGADAFGKVPPTLLLPTVVILAPVAEECIFRGWLGPPRALVLLGGLLAAAGALWTIRDGAAHPLAWLVLVLAVLAAAGGWFALRRRTRPPGSRRRFRRCSLHAVVFALFHLGNYPRITLALVPMVLPQLWAGLVFGFVCGCGSACRPRCSPMRWAIWWR